MERMTTTNPTKALCLGAAVSDTPRRKVSSVEATPMVPMVPRSPRPKQAMAKEKMLVVKEKKPATKEKLKKSSQCMRH